jgi:hypothetical protein
MSTRAEKGTYSRARNKTENAHQDSGPSDVDVLWEDTFVRRNQTMKARRH